MKLKTITVGYTFPGGNFDNFKINFEAELEEWESEEESINLLRKKCLQAAKDAGFNVNRYLPDGEVADLLVEKNEESKKRLKAVREEFEHLCDQNNWYQEDIELMRKFSHAVSTLRGWDVYNASSQVKEVYERLADRHPDLFNKELSQKNKEESEYDPTPFDNEDTDYEDSEEEDDY